ncbi:DMT family transporter [Vibrio scophthalmi]|uniref:DMT family transporter n=2 Tax=Vibrio scophthalmi TaxID=45658 RepID=UPI002FF370A7
MMQGTQTLPLAQRLPITEGLLLLVAIFWGTSYGLTKSALLYTSALMFITLRFSITALVLLPLVVRDFKAGLNKDWVVALPTGAILSAIFLCEVFGVAHTTASNAAFLISLCVLFTALAEVLVNRQKVAWSLVLLCVASVVGVLLLTGSDGARVDFTLGDYLILLAALLRALMVTTTKRFSLGRAVTTTTLTAIQSAVVAGVAAILVLSTLPQSQWHLPTESTFWVTLLYLVAFCTLFAFYVQNYAVRRTSPTRVALLMGSEPLFGALFAMLWLQETFTFAQSLGAGLILFSVMLTSLRRESGQH